MTASLLEFWNLITTDTLTLTAAGVLVLAVLAVLVLVLVSWPARDAAPHHGAPRATQARDLVASGLAAADVSRRTGLSRDTIALMEFIASPAARKKGPGAAGLAFFGRATRATRSLVGIRQVRA